MTEIGGAADVGGQILEVLDTITAVSSPRGREEAAAANLAAWLSRSVPGIQWTADLPGDGSGSVLGVAPGAAGGGDTLMLSHLDTSLSGDPELDFAATGATEAAARLRVDRATGELTGGGLVVAKAPAAAAIVAFARAASHAQPLRARMLLSSRGTHRAPNWAGPTVRDVPETGLERFLRMQPLPRQAIVAKSGPPGVLWEEPGCCYFRIRLTGPWAPVLARADHRPDGGIIAQAGLVIDAVDVWGTAVVRALPSGEQAGAAFGIGAIRSGLPDKPDLLPGALDVFAYLVCAGEVDAHDLRDDLAQALSGNLVGTPLEGHAVSVIVHPVAPGSRTAQGAPIVQAAIDAWQQVHRTSVPTISGWTGSTDGVVLRARGIDTVRTGPTASTSIDGINDRMWIADLVQSAHVYERILTAQVAPREQGV